MGSLFSFNKNMAKKFAKAFYNSSEWAQVRTYVLIRDHYLCRMCGESGVLEVHHKTHLTPDNIGDPNISLNADNLITLCKNCHFKQHELDRIKGSGTKDDCDEAYRFDEDGYLIKNE